MNDFSKMIFDTAVAINRAYARGLQEGKRLAEKEVYVPDEMAEQIHLDRIEEQKKLKRDGVE